MKESIGFSCGSQSNRSKIAVRIFEDSSKNFGAGTILKTEIPVNTNEFSGGEGDVCFTPLFQH